jgi:hypothetical protein
MSPCRSGHLPGSTSARRARYRGTRRAWIGGHGFLIDKSAANGRKKRKSKANVSADKRLTLDQLRKSNLHFSNRIPTRQLL